MMLLPLLMAKNGSGQGSGGGLSPDMIMKMFSASGGATTSNGINPMAAMLMSLMGGKNKPTMSGETTTEEVVAEQPERREKPDPEKIFDKDVLNMLKIFIDLKNAEKESV